MPSHLLIPNQIKAVIFDMDGVIIDTHAAFYRCMINWAEAKGLGLTREMLMNWGSLDSTQFWSRMKTEFHLQEDIETLISSYDKGGEMREYSKIGLMAGLVDLLDRLRDHGICTAVATSGRQFRMSHVLDHFNIRRKFDAVFCNDDIQNPKPDPEIYLLAVAKLDCSVSECLVIEDSSNGIRSARAAGMTCFAHTRNGSNWENLDDANARFDSFDELVIEDGASY